jgi:hypothetical protein
VENEEKRKTSIPNEKIQSLKLYVQKNVLRTDLRYGPITKKQAPHFLEQNETQTVQKTSHKFIFSEKKNNFVLTLN